MSLLLQLKGHVNKISCNHCTWSLTLNLGLRYTLQWVFVLADVILGADFLRHFDLLVEMKGYLLIDKVTSLATKCHPSSQPPHPFTSHDYLLLLTRINSMPSYSISYKPTSITPSNTMLPTTYKQLAHQFTQQPEDFP